MNWEAIGAIGELIGALAVVSTLGYLALQIRQNTKGMRVAAKLEITKQFADYTDLLLLNPELFELNRKGMLVKDLDEIEKGKFGLLMQRATWYFSSMHYQYNSQALSFEEWYESERLIAWFCAAPGFREWWRQNDVNYSVDFKNYLNKVLEGKAK
jgi:hypothetical protein